MTITNVAPLPPAFIRNGRNQPMVTPPGESKRVPYSRVTTFISCLEDTTNFKKRDERFLARGIASDVANVEAIRSLYDESEPLQKRELNTLIDQIKKDAGIWAKAELGTYLHSFCERINRGQEVGEVPTEYIADVAAYTAAMAPFKKLHVEVPTVLDNLKVAGTPDVILEYEGKRYVGDVKTGNVDLAALKNAMQLALYARSFLYDPETEERTVHGAELDKGLIIHAPAGQGVVNLYWIDLLQGWNAVIVARQVREKRRLKFADLCEPLNPVDSAYSPKRGSITSLEDQIKACATADEVRALYDPLVWTDDLTAAAKAHIATLPVAS